jgi:hypothetical protein
MGICNEAVGQTSCLDSDRILCAVDSTGQDRVQHRLRALIMKAAAERNRIRCMESGMTPGGCIRNPEDLGWIPATLSTRGLSIVMESTGRSIGAGTSTGFRAQEEAQSGTMPCGGSSGGAGSWVKKREGAGSRPEQGPGRAGM